jgi:hypothetical protein
MAKAQCEMLLKRRLSNPRYRVSEKAYNAPLVLLFLGPPGVVRVLTHPPIRH